MPRTIVLLLAILGAASAARAGPPSAFEGRALYQSYCLLCHGVDGRGDGPLAKAMEISPANLAAAVSARGDRMLAAIITGRGAQPSDGSEQHRRLSASMPEWKRVFDPSQVDALIAYLRFLERNRHDLAGDPESGAALYQRYCQACHGAEGRGDGIMVNLLPIAPMDHTDAAAVDRIENAHMIKSILDGKGRFMPAWRGILNEAEAAALVVYIRLLAD